MLLEILFTVWCLFRRQSVILSKYSLSRCSHDKYNLSRCSHGKYNLSRCSRSKCSPAKQSRRCSHGKCSLSKHHPSRNLHSSTSLCPKMMQPPPVPVMPRPGEQPEQPVSSIPDRPAIRASNIASSMYAYAQQAQNPPGTGSFFARMQQQKQQQNPAMMQPVNAEELLQEEAQTAFVTACT